MTDINTFLEGVPLFAELTPGERRGIGALAVAKTWQTGETIYNEGEPGESLYLVVEGGVELVTEVSEGIERPLITVRSGSGFGLLEVIDAQPRAVTARAVAETETLEIARSALAEFINKEPASGVNTLYALSAGLARQSRIAVDLLRRNLAWTLEASGAAHLNLNRLITDRVLITVELVSGAPVSGTLLKVEPSAAGHELLVKTADDRIHMIPYHAVVKLTFGARDAAPTEDSLPDM